ncbi:putative deoxyribonuclease tatdn2 [Rhizophlyctis rosea]|uniref:Deoxyribonuclease tatdn2 n=1 Tax=Rhizophlyctis rosea TaxID=64517 RepID=A0AAD5SET1_9FUNG|nr:putative deoxyribonuclease tatdn2 [Rhizophlyctis rosea]
MCPADEHLQGNHSEDAPVPAPAAASHQGGSNKASRQHKRGRGGGGAGNGQGRSQNSQPAPSSAPPASESFHPLTSEEFVDTHTHLHWAVERIPQYKHLSPTEAINRLRHEHFPKNFHACVNVLCDVLSFTSLTNEWQSLVDSCDFMYIAAGLHPHYADQYSETVSHDLQTISTHPRFIALGEIGLDYNRNLSPPEVQKSVFTSQLLLALSLSKPIILHTRDAESDTLQILTSILPPTTTIHVHCFTGTAGFVKSMLDYFPNSYFGFTGVITYESVAELQGVVRDVVPLDKILLETDSPYMPPLVVVEGQAKGKKGKFSQCGDIPVVARKIAELKGVDVDVVMRAARENTRRVYGI